MNIHFDTIGKNQNSDKVTTAYGGAARETKKAGVGAYTIDISGTVMDNNAYMGHGKTTEDVKQDMGNENLTWERNYMAVMSNSMSDEDFARLQEEGFHPGSTEIGTVVTIVDKIKAALAESGTEITGYTDTLDLDTLTEITGNEGLALQLAEQFQKADVPATQENVDAVVSAAIEGTKLQAPCDGAVKYLIENGMEPTLDNLYLAEHSGAVDAGRQAKGYYNAGSGGYLAKKAEAFDWQQLTPQIQKVMEQAGFTSDDVQAMEEAKWLLENGMELTGENLNRLHEIRQLPLPSTTAELAEAAVTALADGKKAAEAVPGRTETLQKQAAELLDKTERVSAEAADLAAAEGGTLTLQKLFSAQSRIDQGRNTEDILPNIRARRQLEEVRLQMTTEANRLLLKSGFSIDTAPMEELIERLKQAENEFNSVLFSEPDEAKAQRKGTLYQETLDTVSYLYGAPAAVLGHMAGSLDDTTLGSLEEEAKSLQAVYEKAGVSYETLMTAPRADLGDSIRKAFRNVDDILEDLQIEKSGDNRRAVRILGYNQMEISEANIETVRAADSTVQKLLKKMTPASVLQMIRDGENPLSVSLEELSDYLDHQSDAPGQEAEKYSKFLYQLEKNGEISEEEKTSFIGIYRMMRTLEKDDGAAVGAMVSQGAELTFSNLLSAVRSRRRGEMDYRVDASFGGVEKKSGQGQSISGQIQAAYTYAQNLIREITDHLSPGLLKQAQLTPDMTLSQAAQALKEAEEEPVSGQEWQQKEMQAGQDWRQKDTESGREWQQEDAARLRQAARVQEGVLETLLEYGMPVTADNLTAAQAYLQERGSAWKDIYDNGVRKGREKELDEKAERLIESFSSREEAEAAYEELAKTASDIMEQAVEEAESSIDVRQMALLHKQISFCADMAREENYELPVSIDGEFTSINLKLRTADTPGQSGRVVITCRTERFGNVAGEFSVREDEARADGYIACENQAAEQYFTGLGEVLSGLLAESGLTESRIQVISGSPVSLERFDRQTESRRTEEGSKKEAESHTSSRILYQTAKQFLTALKTIERR